MTVLLIGFGGVAIFAWRSTIAPISPPAASTFTPELVARGEMLAAAGDYAACHTAKGGAPYAGGHAIRTVGRVPV